MLLAWRGRDDAGALGRVGFPDRAAGYLSVPFYVAGPDGRVLVDPGTATAEDVSALDYTGHGATVEIHDTTVDAGPVTEHPPRVVPPPLDDLFTEWPALRGALTAVGVERDGYDTVGAPTTRIGTAAVTPGEEVYVRGLARRDTGNAGGSSDLDDGGDAARFDAADAVIAHPYGDDPFVLSTRDKGALLDGLGGGYRLYRAGTVLALAGLAVVALAMTGAFVWP